MMIPDRPVTDVADLTDEELDQYILTRLKLARVDLSVLPFDDETAPADQLRILRSARAFLRNTGPAISRLDLPGVVPALFLPNHPPHAGGSSDAP